MPYRFGECVWTTPHNMDHGYVHDFIAVGFCMYEPEAITLIRNSFWLSSPKQPQVAFDLGFMALFQYIFLECRVSLLKLRTSTGSLLEIVSRSSCMSSILSNLKQFNPSYENDDECPACPKEKGSLFISIDALFGCVQKCSAGTNGKSSNHGEELFINQEKVDAFPANYSKRPSGKST
ncbi:hypothetical protein pdam_00017538, partial [Pocillopora damicornis]